MSSNLKQSPISHLDSKHGHGRINANDFPFYAVCHIAFAGFSPSTTDHVLDCDLVHCSV